MQSDLAYLAARMKEASSWAGFAVMALGVLHVNADPHVVSAALGVIVSLGGLLAVLIPETTKK